LISTPLTKNLKIGLIDPLINQNNEIPLNKMQPVDLRTIALSLISKKLFEKINIWKDIEVHVTQFNKMNVWDKESEISFEEDNLGFIIENSILQVIF
jgi:hypothetical protein